MCVCVCVCVCVSDQRCVVGVLFEKTGSAESSVNSKCVSLLAFRRWLIASHLDNYSETQPNTNVH